MRVEKRAPDDVLRGRAGDPSVEKRGLLRGLVVGFVLTLALVAWVAWLVRVTLQAFGVAA